MADFSFGQQHPDRIPVRCARERMSAEAVVTKAEFRFLVHRHLGDHPARRGIQAGEVDAGSLAHQAAAAVAADEIACP